MSQILKNKQFKNKSLYNKYINVILDRSSGLDQIFDNIKTQLSDIDTFLTNKVVSKDYSFREYRPRTKNEMEDKIEGLINMANNKYGRGAIKEIQDKVSESYNKLYPPSRASPIKHINFTSASNLNKQIHKHDSAYDFDINDK